MSYYYNLADDLQKYPDAWCYIIIGGRKTGKTYSALKYITYDKKVPYVFVKRTDSDVDLITADAGKGLDLDFSPYKALNRDLISNIRGKKIKDGIGGFWSYDDESNAYGNIKGYIFSLSKVSKVKGFDTSECDYIVFDEFIKQPWEKQTIRREGESVLDLYATVARDREHRGREQLRLICLANATEISNPLMQTLEVVDDVAEMKAHGESILYMKERGIFIHLLDDNPEFRAEEKNTAIMRGMANTQWGRMALENDFAYNDFSNVKKISLKGYTPLCSIQWKEQVFYIYKNGRNYYMSKSRHNDSEFYDLNKENGQKLFYIERDLDLRSACIEGRMLFETYTMYDIIVNYKSYFKV